MGVTRGCTADGSSRRQHGAAVVPEAQATADLVMGVACCISSKGRHEQHGQRHGHEREEGGQVDQALRTRVGLFRRQGVVQRIAFQVQIGLRIDLDECHADAPQKLIRLKSGQRRQ